MSHVDWLSQLVQMITVTGQLEMRCTYRAPWRVAQTQSARCEIPYHGVLEGRAIIEDSTTGAVQELQGGDVVLLPHGSAHVLHDGSGLTPGHTYHRGGSSGWALSENDGEGERLDMLCGRLFIEPPHDHLIRDYLPTNLVVRTMNNHGEAGTVSASNRLARLLGLMHTESAGGKLGGYALFKVFSSTLFTLALRAAIESEPVPVGLLALAGHARLVPTLSVLFADPAKPWSLSELANVCGMSRDTLARLFRATLGRSHGELLTDLRMSLAANALKNSSMTTKAAAESVGYRSVAAFRRVFSDKMKMTPGRWRRLTSEGE